MPTPHEKLQSMCLILKRFESRISTIVETGTWKAEFSTLACALFDRVYSVERHAELFALAVARYELTRVDFILGDSREHLPRLSAEITEPCVWYLDSHKLPGGGGAGDDDHPLMDELAILNPRKQQDIIVVDDVHAFGKLLRKKVTSDWTHVTEASILAALDRVRHSEVVGDMFAVWRA